MPNASEKARPNSMSAMLNIDWLFPRINNSRTFKQFSAAAAGTNAIIRKMVTAVAFGSPAITYMIGPANTIILTETPRKDQKSICFMRDLNAENCCGLSLKSEAAFG